MVGDALREVLALDQFHHEGMHARRLLETINGGDVRVVQGREGPRFALESRQAFGVGGKRIGQNLDRDLAAERGVGAARAMRSGSIITNGMSIKVSYKDGVFAPLEKVEGAMPDAVYTVFSDEELRDIRETVGWLKAAEKSFDFWNNPADAVYDTL